MSLLNALGTSPLLSLIGWTVVSAFTLGAAAAALVLLCRGIAPRLTAAWQHRLVLALYLLSLASAFAIAAVPRRPAPAFTPGPPVFGVPVAGAVIPAPQGPSALTTNTSRVDLSVAVQEAIGVFAVLSIGLGILALGRLTVGLWLVRRLRRSAMPVADADVLAMVNSLAGRMKICRRIAVRESPEVDTAMTGGWLRPFVLLPPGMAATLGSEIEPVLAHEIAHVRRRDFALAVLQAIADAGTRLSPGHRWLSLEAGRIREQACDDVVITLGVEPLRYARALEALGQWSRGVQVTNVVCAANRHLADRVRRLLEGSSKPRTVASLSAVVALCAGVLATTLVAAVAPGLPAPSLGRGTTARARLISWGDADSATQAPSSSPSQHVVLEASRGGAPYSYEPEAIGVPFRLTAVEPGEAFAFEFVTVASIFPKRIVSLGVGADATSPRDAPGKIAVGLRSTPVDVSIEPGKTARLAVDFIPAAELDGMKRQLGTHVQFKIYPDYARFEDGSSWVGATPPPPAMLTIPKWMVSATATGAPTPAENIPVCYDAEGKQMSEGGTAPVREDYSQWVRCTNGRWVPTRSPVPPDAKLTLTPPQ
jgi:beta-lactamase regulating signal transducer with metallopeptidase domain